MWSFSLETLEGSVRDQTFFQNLELAACGRLSDQVFTQKMEDKHKGKNSELGLVNLFFTKGFLSDAMKKHGLGPEHTVIS